MPDQRRRGGEAPTKTTWKRSGKMTPSNEGANATSELDCVEHRTAEVDIKEIHSKSNRLGLNVLDLCSSGVFPVFSDRTHTPPPQFPGQWGPSFPEILTQYYSHAVVPVSFCRLQGRE